MNHISGKELKKYIKRTYSHSYLIKEACINGENILWCVDSKGTSLVLFVLSSSKQVTPLILREIQEYLAHNVYCAWVSNIAELNIILDAFTMKTISHYRQWYKDTYK